MCCQPAACPPASPVHRACCPHSSACAGPDAEGQDKGAGAAPASCVVRLNSALSGEETSRLFADYFAFTVVRNPYQRMVSSYKFLVSWAGRGGAGRGGAERGGAGRSGAGRGGAGRAGTARRRRRHMQVQARREAGKCTALPMAFSLLGPPCMAVPGTLID